MDLKVDSQAPEAYGIECTWPSWGCAVCRTHLLWILDVPRTVRQTASRQRQLQLLRAVERELCTWIYYFGVKSWLHKTAAVIAALESSLCNGMLGTWVTQSGVVMKIPLWLLRLCVEPVGGYFKRWFWIKICPRELFGTRFSNSTKGSAWMSYDWVVR